MTVRDLAAAHYPVPAGQTGGGDSVRLIRRLEIRWFGGGTRGLDLEAHELSCGSVRGGTAEQRTVAYGHPSLGEAVAVIRCEVITLDRGSYDRQRAGRKTDAPQPWSGETFVRAGIPAAAVEAWRHATGSGRARPGRPTFLNGVLRCALLAEVLEDHIAGDGWMASLEVVFLGTVEPAESVSYRVISRADGELELEGWTEDGGLVERARVGLDARPVERGEAAPVAVPVLPAVFAADGDFQPPDAMAAVAGWGRWLSERGAEPEQVVAVLTERRAASVFVPVATAAVGAMYFPLSVDDPETRVAGLVRQARPVVIVADRAALARLPGGPWRVNSADPAPADRVVTTGGPFRGCGYLMTTSGSSGEPRLHRLPATWTASYLEALQAHFALGPGDCCLHTASFSFSASIRQLFLPLHAGVPLVMASARDRAEPALLAALMRQRAVTQWDTVPSVWRSLSLGKTELPRLRRILLTGEPLSWEDLAEWRARNGAEVVVSCLYSQTETAGTVAIFEVPAELPAGATGGVPLGGPLADVSLHPADRGDGTWELEVRGGRFGGGRVLTGDLVEPVATGGWRFSGRADRRVKIRGMQVDLDAVERTMRSRLPLRDVAVARLDPGVLHAWLVCDEAAGSDESGWRDALREVLPAHHIPARFHRVDALPRTASGKIARARLAVPEESPAEEIAEVPDVLRRIWEEALGRRVPVDATFRDLGGDSLMAVTLFRAVEQAFGPVPVTIGETTTLRDFAAAVAGKGAAMDALDPLIVRLLPVMAGRPGPKPSPSSLMVRVTRSEEAPGHLFFCGNKRDEFDLVAGGLEGRMHVWLADSGYGRIRRTVGEIARLAEWHVRDITRIQPHGPVHLAGYSFACCLATEIARQLVAAGRTVAMLSWVDNLGSTDPRFATYTRWEGRFNCYWRVRGWKAWLRVTVEMWHKLRRREAEPPESWSEFPVQAVPAGPAVANDPPYRFQPTDLPVRLFTATSHPMRRVLLPFCAWRSRDFPDLRVIPVNGDHHTILKDPANARELAGALLREMEVLGYN